MMLVQWLSSPSVGVFLSLSCRFIDEGVTHASGTYLYEKIKRNPQA